MLKSRTIFVCAVMLIFAEIAKILVSVPDAYTIYQGWANSLVLDIVAVWVAAKSEVKHKFLLAIFGSVLIFLYAVIMVVLDYFGLVCIA